MCVGGGGGGYNNLIDENNNFKIIIFNISPRSILRHKSYVMSIGSTCTRNAMAYKHNPSLPLTYSKKVCVCVGGGGGGVKQFNR